MISSGTAHKRFASKAVPFLTLLAVTALFRSSQNAFQTTIGPIGYAVLNLSPSVIGVGIAIAGGLTTLVNVILAVRLRTSRLHMTGLIGIFALALAIVVIVVGDNTTSFIISGVIFGSAGGMVMPVLATLAGRVEGVARDRAISAYTVALSASLAVGPFFESVVLSVNHDSLKGGLLSFLPFPLLALLLFGSLRRSIKPPRSSGEMPLPSKRLAKNPHFRLAVVSLLLYQVPFIAVTAFGALIAHYEYGATVALAQLSFTVFFLVSLVTRSMLVWRHPGEREGLMLRFSALLTFAGTLVLAVGHHLIFLFAAMILLGVPHGLVYPLAISTVARTIPPRDVPRANAAMSAATSAASVISPLILGEIASLFGYSAISLLTLVPIFVLGIWLFLLNPNRSRATNGVNNDPADPSKTLS